jgi:hypothetical protein
MSKRARTEEILNNKAESETTTVTVERAKWDALQSELSFLKSMVGVMSNRLAQHEPVFGLREEMRCHNKRMWDLDHEEFDPERPGCFKYRLTGTDTV